MNCNKQIIFVYYKLILMADFNCEVNQNSQLFYYPDLTPIKVCVNKFDVKDV
jgi:hypothetical protein